jgi:hypothetical protein
MLQATSRLVKYNSFKLDECIVKALEIKCTNEKYSLFIIIIKYEILKYDMILIKWSLNGVLMFVSHQDLKKQNKKKTGKKFTRRQRNEKTHQSKQVK